MLTIIFPLGAGCEYFLITFIKMRGSFLNKQKSRHFFLQNILY
jgi:hypothetical protein